MNKSKKKLGFITLLIAASFVLITSGFAKASEEEDFDSLILKPTQKVLKLRRADVLMRRQGIFKYKKINNELYVLPLEEKNIKAKLAKIEKLKKSGLFDLVEPDYKLSFDQSSNEKNYISVTKHLPVDNLMIVNDENLPDVTTNDSNFKSQYYLKQINATKAWNLTMFENTVLVGVLDTGVKSTHPDLKGRVSGDDLDDLIGHGTEVSGIIAANTNNNQGIAGISWNTQIVSIMVTDEFGQARVSTVASALDRAYQLGVKVIQISLSTNQFSFSLRDAIQLAEDRGLVIITSAGNSGVNELRYPAAFDGVIGVGAVDKNNSIESYSTRGGHVSLVAPGTDVLTTAINGSYAAVTGTSFSAPQVSGVAALILSINPNLTANQVRTILTQSADDLGSSGKDDDFGYGILNAKKALELAKSL
jgi:subtilisin family serine protease